MAVGFLQGVLPDSSLKNYASSVPKVQVLTTDEVFFPHYLREKIESELHVKLSVLVTRDWNSILANVVGSPSADLIFLPSYWAQTLAHENLLADVSGPSDQLRNRLSSDFSGNLSTKDFYFLPIYWIKTGIFGSAGESFDKFLANPKQEILFLLGDEDLLLRHFQIWRDQGLWDKISKKKILMLQLDQAQQEDSRLGAIESPIVNDSQDKEALPNLSALLIYGSAIPVNSNQKKVALEILNILTQTETQESHLLNTPFNSTLEQVRSDKIPLQRRAEFIRNLQLKQTLIIDQKDKDAKAKLHDDFNFTL